MTMFYFSLLLNDMKNCIIHWLDIQNEYLKKGNYLEMQTICYLLISNGINSLNFFSTLIEDEKLYFHMKAFYFFSRIYSIWWKNKENYIDIDTEKILDDKRIEKIRYIIEETIPILLYSDELKLKKLLEKEKELIGKKKKKFF